MSSPLSIVNACLQAYVGKDRTTLEKLIAGDYHFTSPIDNRLDRDTYFAICWPNSTAIASFDCICEVEQGDKAFIVYDGRTSSGKTFRNCEVHTVRDGQLVSTEVYFGWDVPHRLATNTHANNDA